MISQCGLIISFLLLIDLITCAQASQQPKTTFTPRIAAELSREIAFELYHARNTETNNVDDVTPTGKKDKISWEFNTVAILEVDGDLYISASIFSTKTTQKREEPGEHFGLDEVDMAIALKVIRQAKEMSRFGGKINFVNQNQKPKSIYQSTGVHAEPQLISHLIKSSNAGQPPKKDILVLGVNKPVCNKCATSLPAAIEDVFNGDLEVGYIDIKYGTPKTERLSKIYEKSEKIEKYPAKYKQPRNITTNLHVGVTVKVR
ncbi:hypothetical protein Fcan01_23906 [Folsomia candida]|uniref:Uncharacterized protein n=1 Tax=Folsomia candida TaxID=158441 RepID=A0A226D994_FOLCA|nr:hypothetical protein Fcan01_23906 [Folsomia candida]